MGHRTVSGHIRDICDTPTYAHTRDTRMRRRIHVSYLTHTCTHNRACARTQVLGQPHSNTLEELIRECQKCKDSLDDFEAWNSGKNITNSSKELDFVVEPFETPQGWQDQDPKDWTPKHEYGGKRIPIRLQVFMHVLSVLESGVRFGDYKGAHKLDKNDPLWLHAKEVDMLKVVLCRFIKSQLTGQSLINAFGEADEKKRKS